MSMISNASPVATAKPTVLKRHRMALLVLLPVYPLITGLSYGLGPLTAGWQIWQRTLVIAPVMVVLMVFGLIPFITRRFRGFIMK